MSGISLPNLISYGFYVHSGPPLYYSTKDEKYSITIDIDKAEGIITARLLKSLIVGARTLVLTLADKARYINTDDNAAIEIIIKDIIPDFVELKDMVIITALNGQIYKV